jgi:hypothetical protein
VKYLVFACVPLWAISNNRLLVRGLMPCQKKPAAAGRHCPGRQQRKSITAASRKNTPPRSPRRKRTHTRSPAHRRHNRHCHRTHHRRSPQPTSHQPGTKLLARHAETGRSMAEGMNKSRISTISRDIYERCPERSHSAPGGSRTPNPFLRTELLFH